MVVCCLAWGGGAVPASLSSQGHKGCLFHINLLSYRWLHLPRYQQRAPRQQQRPVRAPQHTFRDLQPLLQYLFLLGIAVAAPAEPGPEHPGLPAEAPPGTSRPPDQLPAGERWGLSAPLSPGLFRHPHVASRYSQICGHGMPQDATARWKTTHTSSTTSSTRTLPRVRGVLSSTCVSAPSRLRREDFGSETPNCRRRKG